MEISLTRGLSCVQRCMIVHSGDDLLVTLHAERGFELLILDISMPGALRRFELVGTVRELYPDLPVIICASCDSPAAVRAALHLRVHGVVTKRSDSRAIRQAVEMVRSGGQYYNPSISFPAATMHPWFSLSACERDIALRSARGGATRAIACDTGCAYTTVATHKASILQRLGIDSDGQIAAYICEHDLAFDLDRIPRISAPSAWA